MAKQNGLRAQEYTYWDVRLMAKVLSCSYAADAQKLKDDNWKQKVGKQVKLF